MTEEEQDFPIWRDNDYKLYVTVTFDEYFNTPLADLKLLWGMAQKSDSNDVLVLKDNASLGGIEVISSNVFVVYLNREDTASMNRGKYYHEARAVDTNNNVSQVMVGHITVKDSLINVEADTHLTMLSNALYIPGD